MIVNEEAGKEGGATASGGTYSIDQMSDEEDEAGFRSQGLGGRPITTSQLAVAIMQAQGNQAGPSSSRSGTDGPSITESFFHQAMMSAQQSSVSDAQLQQLRDMGIADESRARQALVQTGGDINAAIALLFDERS